MNETVLRTALRNLLLKEEAHASVLRALEGLKPENRHARPPGFEHSVWEVLEHLRLAQEDILRYTLDASWRSPAFPEGYWPAPGGTLADGTWQVTIDAFEKDLEAVADLACDPKVDLTAEVPHGEGRTYLRQVLLVADHNAYHCAQIVSLRKALGDWAAG